MPFLLQAFVKVLLAIDLDLFYMQKCALFNALDYFLKNMPFKRLFVISSYSVGIFVLIQLFILMLPTIQMQKSCLYTALNL